jgi:hypothetical protein
LNVHNVSDVTLIEIHTAEPLVPGLSLLEAETAIAKLQKYKCLGSDQILAELIQAGCKTLVSVIHKLINSIWNKEKLPDQWKESIIVIIILLTTSYKILSNIHPYIDEFIGIIIVG